LEYLGRKVNQHQVVAYFVMTLGLNFVLGIPGIALLSTGQPVFKVVGFYLLRVAIFSPVISGIFITSMNDSGSGDEKRSARRITFFAIWIFAWLVGTLQMKSTMPPDGGLSLAALILLNAPLGLLPAFVFSRAFARSSSMREYLRTLLKPRGHLVWYFIALLTFPAIHILGNLITRLWSGQPLQTQGFSFNLVWIAFITFMSVFFFTGGINEESGWRGFVLPRLQGRFNPLVAGLIIWACHVIWELNGDVLKSLFMGGDASWPVLSRLVWMPCWTVLFIWVYNRTRGSILAPAFFHSSMNMMNPLMGVLPTTTAGTTLLVLFAFFAVVFDRMWKKTPNQ
jgi:membrane protease YdiL (CAAX protease family)